MTPDGSDTRWGWDINKEEMALIDSLTANWFERHKLLPDWVQHRDWIGSSFTGPDTFVVTVIQRDPTKDMWCMDPETRKKFVQEKLDKGEWQWDKNKELYENMGLVKSGK